MAIIFPSGTKKLFCQTSAPSGWTKDTTNYNEYTIRIVSGTTGGTTGGTLNFSSCFTTRAWTGTLGASPTLTGDTILDSTQIPAHSHNNGNAYRAPITGAYGPLGNPGFVISAVKVGGASDGFSPFNLNGGGAHNHTLTVSSAGTFAGSNQNFSVNYVDYILCTAN